MMRAVRAGGMRLQYELVQTQRHSLELRVTAEGVKVFAPKGVKLRAADDFVRQKADWLKETQERMEQYRRLQQTRHPMNEGAPILVRGQVARLHLDDTGLQSPGLENGVLTVREAPGTQARQVVKALLVDMAQETLGARLEYFIPLVGREPRNVTIREQKTRWGSCSNLGNLNFNWKLIMAPPQALDYVVVHELCHLYELNHGRQFWQRVAAVMPDYAQWVKWLKENGHMLGV